MTVRRPLTESFPLSAVRLLDSPFKNAMAVDQQYLLSLDVDRLLHVFRLNAGLPTSAQPLGGWEKPNIELRGHFVGHYLSACALMYAATGDNRFKDRVDTLVTGLVAVQDALAKRGMGAGYLSAFPESLIDRYEAAKSVWAPWYTLHKIHAGLIDAAQLCGNAAAQDAAVRFAAWVKQRQDHQSETQRQRALDHNEIGGIGESMANLAAITGDADLLRVAQTFDHRQVFDPLADGNSQRLDGLHANTQIPKIIAAARSYELGGDPAYRRIAETFWNSVAIDRAFVIGGHSDHEHFFPIRDFPKHVGPETCETCNTYNMLKLTRHLFSWQPDARYMDFYERALYNHILASQHPTTGMVVYLMSLAPGHFKTYSTPLDSFWCCLGTGVENHAKYAESIYFHSQDAVWMNLFIPSRVTWTEQRMVLRQDTEFPDVGSTTITVEDAGTTACTIHLRHPVWAGTGWSVMVNGTPITDESKPGSYLSIHREWKRGDRINVTLPMTLHTESLTGETKLAAILQGPIVLAGELGKGELPADFNFQAKGQCDFSKMTPVTPPTLVAATPEEALTKLRPGTRPLTWNSTKLGRPEEISLVPFFRLHDQRYIVYWWMLDETTWAKREAEAAEKARQEARRLANLVDHVRIGEAASESAHAFKAERSESGNAHGKTWRHGEWVEYQMTVKPAQRQNLVCTWWSGDDGRSFDVLVDGTKLASVTLTNETPNHFITAEYPLPPELLAGKKTITVRFQAQPGKIAGGVYGCQVMIAP